MDQQDKSAMVRTISDEHGEFLAGDYYDFAAGSYCGVIMPEHVMRKLARLQADYTAEVQRLLTRHADELFASDWTLANKMDGERIEKQVTIRFIQPDGDVCGRIKLFRPQQPTHLPRVYVVAHRESAKAIAESVLAAELAEEMQ